MGWKTKGKIIIEDTEQATKAHYEVMHEEGIPHHAPDIILVDFGGEIMVMQPDNGTTFGVGEDPQIVVDKLHSHGIEATVKKSGWLW